MPTNTTRGEKNTAAVFTARDGTLYTNDNINGVFCRCGAHGKLSGLVVYRAFDCGICEGNVALYLTGTLPKVL